MKCELTKKEVCYLTSYKGMLISISEVLIKMEEEEKCLKDLIQR